MNRPGKILIGLAALALIGLGSMVRFVDMPPTHEPAVASGTGLMIPVAGVSAAQLQDTFGDPRGGGTRGHGALDIPAPRGTPVLAAGAGIIEKLFDSEAGGHTLYIRSADGRTIHYYAHLDDYGPDIAEGVTVARGQAIATVGSTGNASPEAPHLHFEIKAMAPGEPWYRGHAVNPYPLLAGKPSAR